MLQQNDENKLDAETIAKIKAELLEEREQINKDLGDIVSNSEINKVKFPEYGSKMDENAQEIDEYTTNLATDRVLEGALRDIEGALERIEDGSYGVCKYCKKDIGRKRLLARPVASACIECKTKLQNQ